MILTDVVVSHPLTSSQVALQRSRPTTAARQAQKGRKYAHVASRLAVELLNMSVDTCGGLATDAVKLVRAFADEGERWSAGAWSRARIDRQLLGAIAVAVQRGTALVMLAGYSRATQLRMQTRVSSMRADEARQHVAEEEVSEESRVHEKLEVEVE